MKNVLTLLLLLLLSGCISTKQRARNLVRRGFEKIQKGIALDPSVSDSINRLRTVTVTVPGDSGKVHDLEPSIDSAAFLFVIDKYDSLVLASDSLLHRVNQDHLTRQGLEKYIGDLKRTNQALQGARDKLSRSFVKDSTYAFEDGNIILGAMWKDGAVRNITYKIKPQTVTKDVPTTSITLDGSRIIPFWKVTWFWVMLCLILVLLLVIIVQRRR